MAFLCMFGLDRAGSSSRAAIAALMGFDLPWTLAGNEIAAGAEVMHLAMRDALALLGVPVAPACSSDAAWRAQIDWGAAMVFIPLSARVSAPLPPETLGGVGAAFVARAEELFAPRLGSAIFSATEWRAERARDGSEEFGGRGGLLEAFGARSLQAVAPEDGRLRAWESALVDLRAAAERRELDGAIPPCVAAGNACAARL